jgi:hypothetical protein
VSVPAAVSAGAGRRIHGQRRSGESTSTKPLSTKNTSTNSGPAKRIFIGDRVTHQPVEKMATLALDWYAADTDGAVIETWCTSTTTAATPRKASRATRRLLGASRDIRPTVNALRERLPNVVPGWGALLRVARPSTARAAFV